MKPTNILLSNRTVVKQDEIRTGNDEVVTY